MNAETPVNLKDNFELYVNKAWYCSTDLGAHSGINPLKEVEYSVDPLLIELLEAREQDNHEAQLLYTIYSAYTDMESRNRVGLQPLREELSRIQAAGDLDSMNRYLLESLYMDSPPGTGAMPDMEDTDKLILCVTYGMMLPPESEEDELTDVEIAMRDARDHAAEKILVLCGMPRQEAEDLIKLRKNYLEQISAISGDPEELDLENGLETVSFEELQAMAPNFPTALFLENFEKRGVHNCGILDRGWFDAMKELYTQEYALQECKDDLPMPLGKLFSDAYVSPHIKQQITDLIYEVIDVYRKRLENNAWLSQQTIQNAIAKPDNLTIRVAYPEDWTVYNCPDLEIPQNADVLTCYRICQSYRQEKNYSSILKPADKNRWTHQLYEVNAGYSPTDNSVNIPAGILMPPVYTENLSREALLGTLGWTIGHEVSHAFDTNGSIWQYE